MTGPKNADNTHISPYPTPIERVARLEDWRESIEDWRHGIDAWKMKIDRDGLSTSVAVIAHKLDRLVIDVNEISETVKDLDKSRHHWQGAAITGRSIAAIIATMASSAVVVGFIIRLIIGF